jgi:hypothetical protein
VCLIAYRALRPQAEAARGQRRFYFIGFYRAVILSFGIVCLMIGASRLLQLVLG